MAIIIFTFGAIFGSFLNVLIYRLPEGVGVVRKKSHCPKCGKTLKWHELIPVLSFFLLRGKCSGCKAKISWQYPAVEIISGLIWILVFFKIFNFQFLIFNQFSISNFQLLAFFYQIFILSSLVVISFIDVRKMIIPDKIVYPAIFVSLLYNLARKDILIPLAAALAAFSVFYLIVFFSKGRAMGFGDVKLAALMGLFLSYPDILAALWWAFVLGAIFGIMLIAVGRKGLKSQLPFGPFLALGTLIAYFFSWKMFINFIINLSI